MSIIVHFKFNAGMYVQKNKKIERKKKEPQSNLSKKRREQTSDGENESVHFYIGLL